MLSLCQLDAPFRPASRLFSHGKHFVDLTEDDVREHHVHSIAQVFAISTLLWDYLITLDKEIDSIWMRPKSRGVITFLAFRYLTLTTNISAFIFSFYPLEPEVSCSFNALFVILDPSVFRCRRRGVEVLASTVKFFSSFHSAQFAASLVFCNPPSLLIRPYSIIDLSHLRSILLRPENSMVIWNSHRVCGGILWQQFVLSRQDKVRYPILAECHVGISYETAIRIAGLWLTLFVYDTVIFSLTAARTYQFWRKVHLQHLHPSLLSLFFRDGAVYFGVMALVNLANILTFYLCGVSASVFGYLAKTVSRLSIQPFMRGGLSTFTSCTSATLLCRLILNLHTSADAGLYTRPNATLTWRIRTASAMDSEEPWGLPGIARTFGTREETGEAIDCS
ncbi:hypothetical protein WG66_008491 [Moniliophthora roreri]|nr:hypothetical protein WG66_008491 [Moniliophthora roreri]